MPNQQRCFNENCYTWYDFKCLNMSTAISTFPRLGLVLPLLLNTQLSLLLTVATSPSLLWQALLQLMPPLSLEGRVRSVYLGIYLANCQSILPKIDDLHLLNASQSSPSTLALIEIWLHSSIRECDVTLPSYHLFSRIVLDKVEEFLYLSICDPIWENWPYGTIWAIGTVGIRI